MDTGTEKWYSSNQHGFTGAKCRVGNELQEHRKESGVSSIIKEVIIDHKSKL